MHRRKIYKNYKIEPNFQKRHKIHVLHNLQFVHVLFSSSFKSTFLIVLLNEPSDGECLMWGYILLKKKKFLFNFDNDQLMPRFGDKAYHR